MTWGARPPEEQFGETESGRQIDNLVRLEKKRE